MEEEVDRRKEGQIAFVGISCDDDGSLRPIYFFIPPDLIEKLHESLTQEDMEYTVKKILRKGEEKGGLN